MNKLLTASLAVVASLALTSTAIAGGSGGHRPSSAKSLTFALSGAKHRVQVRTGGGCGCYGGIHLDAGSYQDHKVYSGKHSTGGYSSAGNYLNAGWKGGVGISFEGKGAAIGGAAIISGGGKKRRPGNIN